MTIAQPTTPSNKITPGFSGTASEATEVVVHVFEGASEVATTTTTAVGGKWSTSTLSKALPEGKHTFTAYAKEKSGLGNGEGESSKVTFEVNTEPPVVTIAQPTTPSNKITPGFSGTASEATEVEVHVFLGTEEVANVKTTAAGGKWSTSTLSKALPEGKHTFTAVAKEKSGLGNKEGESSKVTFEVNTEPPVVTMAQPTTPSNKMMPGFAGTASEATEVVVHVFEGSTEVANVRDDGLRGHVVDEHAEQGAAGRETHVHGVRQGEERPGEQGRRKPKVTFEVNTEPPVVTLAQPTTPSNKITPPFSGTASEATEVEVHVFEGATEVANVSTTASGGAWSTSTLSKALPEGKHTFTAYATEKSGLGNGEGKSTPSVTFEVNTLPPVVTLAQPTTPSNKTTPPFSGTASEETKSKCTSSWHRRSREREDDGVGGKWSTSTLSKALPEGNTSSRRMRRKSGLGNAEGKSTPVASFEVDTEPPVVTLVPPAEVSNNMTPAFTGAASEAGSVTVEVFKGGKVEGKPYATLVVPVSGGKWGPSHLATELGNGKYAAVASEPSALGNLARHSQEAIFEVDTNAPTVTVTQPPSPSSNTKPSFSGTVAGEAGETVTVYLRRGATGQGPVQQTLTAKVVGGAWKSGEAAQLPSGEETYTVVAQAPSKIGNEEGKSAPVTFIVNTNPPTVTLRQPKPLSNDSTPAFSGTSSETGSVVVKIYSGEATSGTPAATETAKVAGTEWTTKALGKPLADGQYTAVATQESAIGNGTGTSEAASFTIDTKPPSVAMKALPTPSSNRLPSFSGTAGESAPVTVQVFSGPRAEGTPVVTMKAEVTEGEWFSGAVEERLEWGEYTAVASEPSTIGNGEGRSAAVTFVVAQIPPEVLTEGASAVTRTSAALYGSVNPLGAPVSTCEFQVGPALSYGREVGCGFVSGATAFPPAAVGDVPVFIRIYGLTPGTTYHYRVLASSEGGTGTGADETFTTLPSLAAPVEPPKQSTASSSTGVGVAGFFAAQLKPTGKSARIGALLKAGLFKQRFKAPEAGTAVIRWYYLPRGAKLADAKLAKKKAAPAPVLVAGGTVTFHAAGAATVKIRLTAAGRRLLRNSKDLQLTATCAFKPLGGVAVTTSGTFQLRR